MFADQHHHLHNVGTEVNDETISALIAFASKLDAEIFDGTDEHTWEWTHVTEVDRVTKWLKEEAAVVVKAEEVNKPLTEGFGDISGSGLAACETSLLQNLGGCSNTAVSTRSSALCLALTLQQEKDLDAQVVETVPIEAGFELAPSNSEQSLEGVDEDDECEARHMDLSPRSDAPKVHQA